MHFRQSFAAILLCAAIVTLPPFASPAAASQKARPRAQQPQQQQAPAPHTEITKEKIETIISAIEAAAKKKDVAVIASYLAPDMKFKLDGGGRPTRYANRAQYIEMVKIGIGLALDYEFIRKSTLVTIAPDGQSATAQTETFEMLTLAQGTITSNVVSTATFKIYKGKILIASMDGTITYL